MLTATEPMSLQELLRSQMNIHSVSELRRLVEDLSRQQAWMLWHGKTTLGLRTAKRIAQATGLSLDIIAEVKEAVPGCPRARKPRAVD